MPRRDLLNNLGDRGRIDLSPVITRRVQVDAVEDTIHKDMVSSVKARLGLQGDLPAEVTEVVRTAASAAAASAVELTVADAAQQAARDVGRASITSRFDDKIKVAADSLAHISASNEVDEVLRKRSELLAKKRDSLVAAGFSGEEAMQILLADIAARAH